MLAEENGGGGGDASLAGTATLGDTLTSSIAPPSPEQDADASVLSDEGPESPSNQSQVVMLACVWGERGLSSFRVEAPGLGSQGERVQGPGSRVQGPGSRVQGP
eukprot:833327-Rhodomonas_salina.1